MSYRDEEVAQLHKKVADLQDLLKSRPEIVHKREWIMPKIETVFAWTGWVAVVAFGFLGLWALAHVWFIPSKIEYCYVTYANDNGSVYLKASRPWDNDLTMSKHASFHDAVLAAEEMHCPLSGGVETPTVPRSQDTTSGRLRFNNGTFQMSTNNSLYTTMTTDAGTP